MYCFRMRPSAGGFGSAALPFQELGNSSRLVLRFSGAICLNFSRAARSLFGAKGLLVPSGPPVSPLRRGGATTSPRAVKTAPNPQPLAASGMNSLLIGSTVESAMSLNVQNCTATHMFQPYPQGRPTKPGPYAITGLPSLAALTAASQGSRSQAILAMFVTCSPGFGRTSSRTLASFASVSAIAAESAGCDFAPAAATGLADFGASAVCARSPPPVTVTDTARIAAPVLSLVIHMASILLRSNRDRRQLEHLMTQRLGVGASQGRTAAAAGRGFLRNFLVGGQQGAVVQRVSGLGTA